MSDDLGDQNRSEGGVDIFDVTFFIENDRKVIRSMWFFTVPMFFVGIGLMVAATQSWLPLDNTIAEVAGFLSGVCSTVMGAAAPFTLIRSRSERIRIVAKLKSDYDALRRLGDPDNEDLQFLKQKIRELYGERLLA